MNVIIFSTHVRKYVMGATCTPMHYLGISNDKFLQFFIVLSDDVVGDGGVTTCDSEDFDFLNNTILHFNVDCALDGKKHDETNMKTGKKEERDKTLDMKNLSFTCFYSAFFRPNSQLYIVKTQYIRFCFHAYLYGQITTRSQFWQLFFSKYL